MAGLFAQKTQGQLLSVFGRQSVCEGAGLMGLSVSMVLTEADNRSGDCAGSMVSAADLQTVTELLGSAGRVTAFCVCPSPGREVLIGPSYAESKVQGRFLL